MTDLPAGKEFSDWHGARHLAHHFDHRLKDRHAETMWDADCNVLLAHCFSLEFVPSGNQATSD